MQAKIHRHYNRSGNLENDLKDTKQSSQQDRFRPGLQIEGDAGREKRNPNQGCQEGHGRQPGDNCHRWLIVSSPDQVLNTEWNDGTCKEITANSEKTFDPRHTFLALQIANPS